MAQKTINGSLKMAEKIRTRRLELRLTIEEAAKRAGVGTKTWCRYEAGESIRQDKYKGLCRALNWVQLPNEEDDDDALDLNEYQMHEAWSKYLEDNFGEVAALSFAIGSDILLDYINEDLAELSERPRGTHVGQLGTSFIASLLPAQFLMNYDYEFVYAMKLRLVHLRNIAKLDKEIIAHSVIDEIILMLVADESEFLIESSSNIDYEDDWKEWVFDIFGDADVEMCLYSNIYISADNCYHFTHWFEDQFYCD